MPFILREHLSYSELAIFSLSGYPYSLKLLWSPIVDSVFFTSIGRRKSWIIPMQLCVGAIMLAISFNAEQLMTDVCWLHSDTGMRALTVGQFSQEITYTH